MTCSDAPGSSLSRRRWRCWPKPITRISPPLPSSHSHSESFWQVRQLGIPPVHVQRLPVKPKNARYGLHSLESPGTDYFSLIKTLCPGRARGIEGELIVRDGKMLLSSEFPTRGVHETILSNRGEVHADLDTFYSSVSDEPRASSRIFNCLVLIETRRPINCSYRMAEINSPSWSA